MFAGMDGITIKPTGIIGATCILLGKLVFFVIVFNFLMTKISKYIRL